MKALVVRQPWASLIVAGKKTIETRTWATNYRGPILIVAGKRWADNTEFTKGSLPVGKAIGVATLVDCRPMVKKDEPLALCKKYPGAFSWVLKDIRRITPFPVKGRLGLFEVPYHPHIGYQED